MERCLTGRLSAIVAVVLAALAITGCSSQVALKNPSIPEPLLNQLPLKVAVRYSPEMTNYVHEEEVLGRQKWTINLGAANKLAFRQLFRSMFSEVVEVDADTDAGDVGADALIEAGIEAFEFALPAQSRTDAYTIWIRYRLRIFDDEGTEVTNWPIAAYGKAGSEGMFSADEALARAAVLAMRDAAAMIGLRFARETGMGDPGGTVTPAGGPEAGESLNVRSDPPGPAEAGAVRVVAPPEPEDDAEVAAEEPPGDGAGTVEIAGPGEGSVDDRDDVMDDGTEEESLADQPADVAANTDDANQGNYTDDRG